MKSRMEWGRGPVREGGRLVCLMRNYKNLYADLSANSGGCAIMRDEKFGLQFLEEFQDRLMFGTDMVNTDMVFPLGEWLDRQYQEGKIICTGLPEKFVLRMPKRYFSYKRKGEK